jgi:hypothetical protein
MKQIAAILLLICVFYIHLINGEVIRAKEVTREKWSPEYRVVTIDGAVIRIPFTSVLKIIEKKE